MLLLLGIFVDAQASPTAVTWYRDPNLTYDGFEEACTNRSEQLCTFDQLCPAGEQQPPVGGQQDFDDMWAPIRNGNSDDGLPGGADEDWVQVGRRDGGICNRHSNFYGGTHPRECCCGDWCHNPLTVVP